MGSCGPRAHLSTSKQAPSTALKHVDWSHGQPCSLHHRRRIKSPLPAASGQVFVPQGAPFSRAHLSTPNCPNSAAREHAPSYQGQPLAVHHSSIPVTPHSAATSAAHFAHALGSQGQPFTLHHSRTSTCPPFAADSQVLSSHEQMPHLKRATYPTCTAAIPAGDARHCAQKATQ